jgi:hypothetical protein
MYKTYSTYDEEGVGKVLYYVTQMDPPSKKLANIILDDNPDIDRVYIALRDNSSYDLERDLRNGEVKAWDRNGSVDINAGRSYDSKSFKKNTEGNVTYFEVASGSPSSDRFYRKVYCQMIFRPRARRVDIHFTSDRPYLWQPMNNVFSDPDSAVDYFNQFLHRNRRSIIPEGNWESNVRETYKELMSKLGVTESKKLKEEINSRDFNSIRKAFKEEKSGDWWNGALDNAKISHNGNIVVSGIDFDKISEEDARNFLSQFVEECIGKDSSSSVKDGTVYIKVFQ